MNHNINMYLNNKNYRPRTRSNPVSSGATINTFAFDLVDINKSSLSGGN